MATLFLLAAKDKAMQNKKREKKMIEGKDKQIFFRAGTLHFNLTHLQPMLMSEALTNTSYVLLVTH